MNRNIATGIASGLGAVGIQLIDVDPTVINEGLTTIGTIILAVVSLWKLIKGIFTKNK